MRGLRTNVLSSARLAAGLAIWGFASLALLGCSSSKAPEGAPLDRVAAWNENPTYRQTGGAELLEWVATDTPVTIIHTPEDELPNGLASVMAPLLVDWNHSKLDGEDSQYVVVHNVQVAGNPLLGISRHASVLIPVGGIEKIEYVIVRYHLEGFAKYAGHTQLRFVFEAGSKPVLLGPDGTPDKEQPQLDDLVLSWEAWRDAQSSYSFSRGLEEDGYRLTPRLYSGAQRFLNDSLRGAVWDCYPLKLADDEQANDYVLFAGLIMGDAVGRRVISEMLDTKLLNDASGEIARALGDDNLAKARGRLDWEQVPKDVIAEYMKDADISYHTFDRSCISVSLAQIDVAMERLHQEKNLGPRKRVKAGTEEIPKWFDDLRNKDTWNVIKGAPRAFFWIQRNKDLLPYKAYLPLEEADLLYMDEKGKPIMYRYKHDQASPYGALKRNLM